MTTSLSDEQVWRLRLRAQRLLPQWQAPGFAPAQVLDEVIGVQAQDMQAALQAVRARGAGLSAGDVTRARQQGPAILQTWCMRGTLHLVSRADAAWLVPLFAPGLIAGDRRRLIELGWDEDSAGRGLRLLQAALAERGSLARAEITQLLAQAGLPSAGQAPVHLIYRAALEMRLCIGPERGKQTVYLPYERWAGPANPLPRDEAHAALARRYLAAYGPATPTDLASWSGLKLPEARGAWQRIAGGLTSLETARGPLWLLTSRLPWLDDLPAVSSPQVRLLPWFDNLLLGYASRDWVCPPAYARRINPGGGMIHPTLLIDGAVRATWKLLRQRRALELHLVPFEPLAPSLRPSLEAEVSDIARFLGEPVTLSLDNLQSE